MARKGTGTIEGTVYNRRGNPSEGAEVYFYLNGTLKGIATTNENGWYSANDLQPGDYTIRLKKVFRRKVDEPTTVIHANRVTRKDFYINSKPVKVSYSFGCPRF